MPAHDWTRVSDGAFHDFHYSWVLEIKRALKRGLLPEGYYVMAEQIGGDIGAPDVLTLQTAGTKPAPEGPIAGTATLAESPPLVHARATIPRDAFARMQRSIVIRHVSVCSKRGQTPGFEGSNIRNITQDFGHSQGVRPLLEQTLSDDRIVAMIEVLSPGNKSSRQAIRSFLDKAVAALDGGVHLLLVDVFPPGPRDPNGIHGALLAEIGREDYRRAGERPLTAAAYIGGAVVDAFVSHFAVGEPIPEMPLFLSTEHYVRVPLEPTYMAAWEDVPRQYQEVLLAS